MRRPHPSILLLLTSLLQLACSPAAPDRIVVITLDTTRADALGAYGQRDPTSPRIDHCQRSEMSRAKRRPT